MTYKERKLALYCLKASSEYHSEVCEECINYPNCDHMIQDDITETIIKALEQEPCDNATNGQVLLKMFPPSVYYGDDEKHIVLLAKDCELTCYNNEWWNAPYKAESEE